MKLLRLILFIYFYRKYTIVTPDHWLSYLAPELIKSLSADFRSLPFSEESDVYAFG